MEILKMEMKKSKDTKSADHKELHAHHTKMMKHHMKEVKHHTKVAKGMSMKKDCA
jgi:hypothetical protein